MAIICRAFGAAARVFAPCGWPWLSYVAPSALRPVCSRRAVGPWLSYVAPSALGPVCSRRAVGPGYHMSRLRRCGPCVRARALGPWLSYVAPSALRPVCSRPRACPLATIFRAFGAGPKNPPNTRDLLEFNATYHWTYMEGVNLCLAPKPSVFCYLPYPLFH